MLLNQIRWKGSNIQKNETSKTYKLTMQNLLMSIQLMWIWTSHLLGIFLKVFI